MAKISLSKILEKGIILERGDVVEYIPGEEEDSSSVLGGIRQEIIEAGYIVDSGRGPDKEGRYNFFIGGKREDA